MSLLGALHVHIEWPAPKKYVVSKNTSGVRIDMNFEVPDNQKEVTITFSGLQPGVNPTVIFRGNTQLVGPGSNYSLTISLP
jgi:hypothetical protein